MQYAVFCASVRSSFIALSVVLSRDRDDRRRDRVRAHGRGRGRETGRDRDHGRDPTGDRALPCRGLPPNSPYKTARRHGEDRSSERLHRAAESNILHATGSVLTRDTSNRRPRRIRVQAVGAERRRHGAREAYRS